MQAIRIETVGGPEVMQLVTLEPRPPGAGEALVRHHAIGVNFIDTYHRSGLYPRPLPSGLGVEAAGVVEAVGTGVTHVRPGDRVVYCAPAQPGSYAQTHTLDARWLVALPDAIPDELAAASWLKGCTVEFLVERCARVQPGQIVLVTAAAGGVGQLLVQWLKAVGATVIATVGSQAKRPLVEALGADRVLLHAEAAGTARSMGGAHAVLDGVGRDLFDTCLACLRPRGLYVNFGNASGPVGTIEFGRLAAGSLFATRPTLMDYYRDAADFAAGTQRLLAMLPGLTVEIGGRWPLARAADCHRALEARQTTGSQLLLP